MGRSATDMDTGALVFCCCALPMQRPWISQPWAIGVAGCPVLQAWACIDPSPRFAALSPPPSSSSAQTLQVACGGMHTVALTEDRQLYSWGVNDEGALGRETGWCRGLQDRMTAWKRERVAGGC